MARFLAFYDDCGDAKGVLQSEKPEIWNSLKSAIAASSGFQRWQLERLQMEAQQELSLDHQVRRYLRETLETLAY
jgi:tryptophan 2,3-dioxygenase